MNYRKFEIRITVNIVVSLTEYYWQRDQTFGWQLQSTTVRQYFRVWIADWSNFKVHLRWVSWFEVLNTFWTEQIVKTSLLGCIWFDSSTPSNQSKLSHQSIPSESNGNWKVWREPSREYESKVENCCIYTFIFVSIKNCSRNNCFGKITITAGRIALIIWKFNMSNHPRRFGRANQMS